MAAFARQGGEPLPHGAIEPRNYGVLSTDPPWDCFKSASACSKTPWVILRVTSTTRIFWVRLITVAIHKSGQTRKEDLPRPAVSLIFSRNARVILLG